MRGALHACDARRRRRHSCLNSVVAIVSHVLCVCADSHQEASCEWRLCCEPWPSSEIVWISVAIPHTHTRMRARLPDRLTDGACTPTLRSRSQALTHSGPSLWGCLLVDVMLVHWRLESLLNWAIEHRHRSRAADTSDRVTCTFAKTVSAVRSLLEFARDKGIWRQRASRPLRIGRVIHDEVRLLAHLRTSTVKEIGVDVDASAVISRYDSLSSRGSLTDLSVKILWEWTPSSCSN